MLDLDVPVRSWLRADNRANVLVLTGLVVLLARGAGAGGVEAGGVRGGYAEDVEAVGAAAALGGGDGEVGGVPGQGRVGLALGEGAMGSSNGEGGEEGDREDGGELHCGV